MAKELNIPNYRRYRKQELIMRILQAQTEQSGLMLRSGILEIMPEGYGFLRHEGYLPGSEDIYVSPSQIKRFGLRVGDEVLGQVRPPKDNEKYYALLRVEAVNGLDPEQARTRPDFERLTPVFPHERIKLESNGDITTRMLDLFAPIGKGQRAMIVSPPKAGKTTLLKKIGQAVVSNDPEIYLMVLLLDERPEEVTDMRRSVEAEVVASTFDRPPESISRWRTLYWSAPNAWWRAAATWSSCWTASPASPAPTTWSSRRPGARCRVVSTPRRCTGRSASSVRRARLRKAAVSPSWPPR